MNRRIPRAGLLLAALALTPALAMPPHASPLEGPADHFLGAPVFDARQLFERDRFPNLAVAIDGTVLAFWDGVRLRRSLDGGESWGPEITVAKGFMGGGVTVDEVTGAIFAFVEEGHPPSPLAIHRSDDHGASWRPWHAALYPGPTGNVPAMHMNEHGITLRRGPHAGRLIRPSRWYGLANRPEIHWPTHYTNAIYSDDRGRTWRASAPFPEMGTGEACIVERADGVLYYNTRRHWAPEPELAMNRWTAVSQDGGLTWQDHRMSPILPDGNRDSPYGLMAGLVRLPIQDRDVLVFSNILSDEGRKNGVVWASFDGGESWPLRRTVDPGPFAYSSLNAGRPGTPSQGWIYLLYETGGHPHANGRIARFNLAWLLEGEQTGDGALPEWLREAAAAGPEAQDP